MTHPQTPPPQDRATSTSPPAFHSNPTAGQLEDYRRAGGVVDRKHRLRHPFACGVTWIGTIYYFIQTCVVGHAYVEAQKALGEAAGTGLMAGFSNAVNGIALKLIGMRLESVATSCIVLLILACITSRLKGHSGV